MTLKSPVFRTKMYLMGTRLRWDGFLTASAVTLKVLLSHLSVYKAIWNDSFIFVLLVSWTFKYFKGAFPQWPSEPFVKFIIATVFVTVCLQTCITDELTGYLGIIAARLQPGSGSHSSKSKLIAYFTKLIVEKYICKLGDHVVAAKLAQESLSNIWRKTVTLMVERQSCWAYRGWNNFPHSGEARQPGPHQSCIINALDKNIDNPRTARDENSPDLN